MRCVHFFVYGHVCELIPSGYTGFSGHVHMACAPTYDDSPQTAGPTLACSTMQAPAFEGVLSAPTASQSDLDLVHRALSGITGELKSSLWYLSRNRGSRQHYLLDIRSNFSYIVVDALHLSQKWNLI